MSDIGLVSNMVLTADGTITARDAETGELYHNRDGAYLEALENYVLPSRWYWLIKEPAADRSIVLLDACFGLGYNTFTLWDQIVNNDAVVKRVDVLAIERDHAVLNALPVVLEQDCFQFLENRVMARSGKTLHKVFQQLAREHHEEPSIDLQFTIDDFTVLRLHIIFGDLRSIVPSLGKSRRGSFDLVFHDPFSPSKVPELWTVDLFKEYFHVLNDQGGRLLTYSAASAVRGGLREAGFSVWRTKGVGAKKGGTLAIRGQSEGAEHGVECGAADLLSSDRESDGIVMTLREEESERLVSFSGIPYRDPGFQSTRREILKRREDEQRKFTLGKADD